MGDAQNTIVWILKEDLCVVAPNTLSLVHPLFNAISDSDDGDPGGGDTTMKTGRARRT